MRYNYDPLPDGDPEGPDWYLILAGIACLLFMTSPQIYSFWVREAVPMIEHLQGRDSR